MEIGNRCAKYLPLGHLSNLKNKRVIPFFFFKRGNFFTASKFRMTLCLKTWTFNIWKEKQKSTLIQASIRKSKEADKPRSQLTSSWLHSSVATGPEQETCEYNNNNFLWGFTKCVYRLYLPHSNKLIELYRDPVFLP